LALEALIQVDKQGTFTSNALAKAFERKELSDRDRAFVTALVMGVTRNKAALDAAIKEFSSRPLEKLPVPLLNTLRLGTFQLMDMPDIPPSAVLNTCAELAKAVGHIGQARFVNGLLRNFLRNKIEPKARANIDDKQTVSGSQELEKKSHRSPKVETDDVEVLSQNYSMPTWIVRRWSKNFGHEEALKLLHIAQQPAKLTLRTCTAAITVEGLLNILTSKGFATTIGSLVPTCFILESSDKGKAVKGPPQKIPGYSEGLFSIQDEASAFISCVVDPEPGQLVVDLCAAPGSKTMHLSELMDGTGQVIAIDKNAKKLELIGENRLRLGLTNIQIHEGDSRVFTLNQGADRVLLDAPCMGTGVIGRRPDIRHHRTEADLAKLAKLQKELLNHASGLVKPGGVLVYSTCSLEPEENIENVNWFLENHPEFKASDLTKYVPAETLANWQKAERHAHLKRTTAEDLACGYVQLLPSRHGVSGFFVARMVKDSG
jgi:16S rRNA (cytosine967-C5)-methyltransferase